jgi:acetyl esterase/lipase
MSMERVKKGEPGTQHGAARSRWNSVIPWLSEYRIKRGALFSWAVLLLCSALVMHTVALVGATPPSLLLTLGLALLIAGQAIAAGLVVGLPARRVLLAAGVLQALAVVLWVVGHTAGLPDGHSLWRAETLAVPDLFLPLVEGLSAGFFLVLGARTWPVTSRLGRVALVVLPYALVAALLILIILKSVSVVVFFLVPGALNGVVSIFLPLAGALLAFLLLRLLLRPLRSSTPRATRVVLILLPALLLLTMTTWGGGVSALDTAWLASSTTVDVPAGGSATINYCQTLNGATPLAMDISEPAAGKARPAPALIFIHGGETLVGSRIIKDGSLDGMYFDQLRTDLLQRGFIVTSIDYGLVPLYNVGEQVRDAKCAVRFLRAHAHELGLDPQRIAAAGTSQGGYLSAMLATLGPDSGADTGQYLNQSSRIQAVVDMWGPMDISNFSGSPGWASLLAGSNNKAQLRRSSPLYHVAPGDPPFMIIYGVDDWFIAPHHSLDMARALRQAGVPVTLLAIQHDGHGLAMPTSGETEQPAPAQVIRAIADFLSKTLMG